MNDNNTNSLDYLVLEIADIPKFYNPFHKIIRVKYKETYYDLKCDPGVVVPNQQDHLVLAVIPHGLFDYISSIPDHRQVITPGLENSAGQLAQIPQGICFLISSRQTISTANPQNASAGMSITNTNMFDMDKVAIAISPPLVDRDYTTLDDGTTGDINNLAVGVFINKQGTVLIKSQGGSVTLGKEGVHIGGKVSFESSTRDTGILSDNTFADMIPSTIPTAGIAIPKLPNVASIASVANAAMKFIDVIDKTKQISQILA